jgi:Phage tail lysozyme
VTGLPTGAFNNAEAIYRGLLAMGLNPNAAAGVAGNIYQESHGNPGSASGAGGGLFGETVQNGGSTTGGSLAQQLSALQKYIAANGSISAINANASTPAQAAQYFMSEYERPGIPDAGNRVAAAQWVAAAASSGNWGAGVTTNQPGGTNASVAGDILSWFSDPVGQVFSGVTSTGDSIAAVGKEIKGIASFFEALTMPQTWIRVGACLGGIFLGMTGFFVLTHADVKAGQAAKTVAGTAAKAAVVA